MNDLERDLRGATAAHRRLEGRLEHLTDVQARQPSLLPGWTIGHVLTHLARNAESHIRLLEAAGRGEVGTQYPGGDARRNGDIEAGAGRPAAELVADVVASNAALEAAWAETTDQAWTGEGSMKAGLVKVSELPIRRWREADVHHVDLGLGYLPSDWPAEYVRLDLQMHTMRWNSRRPMGLTGLPAAALAVPEHHRLAWLLGRAEIEGLEHVGQLM